MKGEYTCFHPPPAPLFLLSFPVYISSPLLAIDCARFPRFYAHEDALGDAARGGVAVLNERTMLLAVVVRTVGLTNRQRGARIVVGVITGCPCVGQDDE